MIDFRYHLVSLIAVFLAIALGIVIGTTALNGPLVDNLNSQVSGLQDDKRSLEDQNQGLQGQLSDVGAFEEAVAPALVGGTLAERTVVVLQVGAVDADVLEQVTGLLGTAGATVTGTVQLTDSYGDPALEQSLLGYLNGPGVPQEVERPITTDVDQLAAAVLAQVLMEPASDGGEQTSGPSATAAASVLAGLSGLGVLSYDTPPTQGANYAVVLTGTDLTAQDSDAETAAVLQLLTAVDAASSGAVLAGPAGSDAAGLVAAARADAGVDQAVSTVDNVDAAAGRISTVLALSSTIAGAYGTGGDTQPAPPVEQ